MATYDVIIGMEFHVQSKTKSKMFCSCSADHFGKQPNSQTCPVCLGLPGALPVPNRHAIELCVVLGLAFNCDIAEVSKFDRKHYWYPDLPKGYQISQYDKPFCTGGFVEIDEDNEKKKFAIRRIHQEEDVAKITRKKDGSNGKEYALIDFNKSGVPLIEIVLQPEIHSAHDARMIAEKIRQTARYLKISDADMEKGQMRCEPNLSLQKPGTWKYENGEIVPGDGAELNPPVEIKNLGSISAIENALDFEIKRLSEMLDKGETVRKQTRGWDPVNRVTTFQRYKETSADYRYFPEPDIPSIKIDAKTIDELRSKLTELPGEKLDRYKRDYGLSDYDAKQLSKRADVGAFFDRVLTEPLLSKIEIKARAKLLANWLLGPLFALLKANSGKDLFNELDVTEFCRLLVAVHEKKISNQNLAKEYLADIVSGKKLDELMVGGLEAGGVEEMVSHLIADNPKAVGDFKAGNKNAISFFMGLVMRETKGKADPSVVRKEIESQLNKK